MTPSVFEPAALLAHLHLDRAPDDATRARLLAAVRTYAQACGASELAALAQAQMPAADPFTPPAEWAEHYHGGFADAADEDRGTYAANSGEYIRDYWQMFTDAQRRERLADPRLGWRDGQRDAEGMNAA